MFIRTERSIKEFIHFYPIVSTLVIIHIVLWLIIDLLQLPIGIQIEQWGIGNNYFIAEGEYWRLFTPIFLHGDVMHMLFNSFSLVLFGPALEQMLGKGKFLVAYIGSGFAGNLGTYLMNPDAFFFHLGASGAIFGLFGIYLFMVFFRKTLIDQANAQIVLTIFIIGLIMTFLRPGINQEAHIFGLIGGFALAPLLLSNVHPFSPWRNRQRYSDDDTIQFDPNRWNKKRLIPRSIRKNLLWIIIAAFVLLGLLSRIGFL
ncbi:rhomboid family intramembrane serine protease [Virgibacillus sp. MG-45]|uniref:rhomboid family intramembrane serine protease n=1 Tax=Virgibacillus sp. MG-45 TaxID=3102791 RepID=UPI002ED9F4D2